jgi:hypothetical protein
MNTEHSRRDFLKISSASLLTSALSTSLLADNHVGDSATVDVVVYGATPAGITAAVAAKRDGASVLLISPDDHIGGLMTSGLSRTDVMGAHHVGGIARDILNDIGDRTPKPTKELYRKGRKQWDLEPGVAMRVFRGWIKKEDLTLWTGARLNAVRKQGTQIRQLEFMDGRTVTADVFLDTTYEGDLMAKADVSYFVGRESRDRYDEPHAGWFRYPTKEYPPEAYQGKGSMLGGPGPYYMHDNQFGADLPARDGNGNLLWGVHLDAPREPGTGDAGIQAYCFRLSVTNRPELRVPWPKPDNYYPERYELLLRYIKAHPGMSWHALLHLTPTSDGKFDMNASGPFTIDYVGGAWYYPETPYPEASYRERERIVQDHEDYQKGFLWFLANDRRVPEKIRNEANRWGLCKDEFVDNGHWPPEVYVREGRRMIGSLVVNENHVQKDATFADVIGRASFVMDSHPVTRFENKDGYVREEGHIGEGTDYYHIPYRSIVPKRKECGNLLAPVPLSASHVAFGSIRLEPTWMVLGHSAGTAAAQAANQEEAVQEINVRNLQKRLNQQGQVLWSGDRPVPDRSLSELDGVAIGASQAQTIGSWTKSTSTSGFLSDAYLHDNNEGKGNKTLRFETKLPEDGRYEVRLYYPHSDNRASNTPVQVEHAGGTITGKINQRTQPSEGAYDTLGTFRFDTSQPAAVVIKNDGTDGYVVGDAVQFVPVED